MHYIFYNKFISSLSTCFEHMCSSSGGQIVLYSLWYHHTHIGGRPVHGTATLKH